MRNQTILTTRRLRLRTWRSSDARAYHKHCNTPDVMEHLGGVVTPRQLKREVEWFKRHQEREGISFWVIERKRDSEFLGFCGLIRVTEPSSTVFGEIEIGWRVRRDMWRRGYAHEAAAAVLRLGRDKHAERIISRVAPGNRSSRGLMSKLGMRPLPDLDYVDSRDRMQLLVYGI